MLYTKEYIAKGIKGDYAYGTTTELSVFENVLASLIQAVMFLCASFIWVCTKIPLVSGLVGLVAENYPRGGVGFFLRGAYFKAKLRHMGVNVLIDVGVSIWNPQNVSIGDYSHIDTNVKIEGGQSVTIGRYVHVCSNVLLQGSGNLTIDDLAGLAASSLIYSAVNHYTDGVTDRFYEMSSSAPADRQFIRAAPVRIGKSAIVGTNSVIMPGVTLGEGAIVGACSFVSSDVEPYKIATGAPARARWDRTRPQ